MNPNLKDLDPLFVGEDTPVNSVAIGSDIRDVECPCCGTEKCSFVRGATEWLLYERGAVHMCAGRGRNTGQITLYADQGDRTFLEQRGKDNGQDDSHSHSGSTKSYVRAPQEWRPNETKEAERLMHDALNANTPYRAEKYDPSKYRW